MRARKRSRPLLGTFVEIEIKAEATERALNAWITRGFEAVAEVERLMSYYRTDSDLSRLNRAMPGEGVAVHRWTAEVLARSNELFAASNGLFDIRCGAALARAGVLPGGPAPASTEVSAAGALPVELRGTTARKTGPWTLDLGGIAKGFAVDRAVGAIKQAARGARSSGLVNAGGDLRVWGTAAAVAVRGGADHLVLRRFAIRSAAVATSAIRVGRGQRRESPAGYVSRGRLVRRDASATVVAESCLDADALTKVALLAAPARATQCLRFYGAKAVVFLRGPRVLG